MMSRGFDRSSRGLKSYGVGAAKLGPFAFNFHDDQEVSNFGPDTPSLTQGSSGSDCSSSITACELCGSLPSRCECQSRSDNEDLVSIKRSRISKYSPLVPRNDETPSNNEPPTKRYRFVPLTTEKTSTSNTILGGFPCIDSDNSSSTYSEMITSESEDDDYDNDWSGQNNDVEGLVLEALQGDLPFAAQLIPVLHKYFYLESAKGVTQKVSPWRYGITKRSPGTAQSSAQASSSSGHNRESTNPRKRHRSFVIQNNEPIGDQDDEDDHSEGDGNRRPKGANGPLQIDGAFELPRLACPFNKWNPQKYGIKHEAVGSSQKTDYYRACAGPGFKSIQRLKEHLKRKHYPVQCDRCYLIFHGPDRASCVLALQSHRQLETSCERQPDSLQEGISDAQSVSLDKKSSIKKNQQASRVEKWMEIWSILFPGVAQPDTPWYDDRNSNRRLQAPTQEVQRFAALFKPMLDLQVSQRHIRFLEGSEELMKARVENLAQKAIALFIGTSDIASSTDSSSARSRQHTSLLSGSYAHVSTQPTSRGHNSTSTFESRSTTVQSHGFSADLSSTPIGVDTRRASSPGPAYLDMQPMRSGDYPQYTMTSPLPNQVSGNSSYHLQLPASVEPFASHDFSGQDMIDFHGTFQNDNAFDDMRGEESRSMIASLALSGMRLEVEVEHRLKPLDVCNTSMDSNENSSSELGNDATFPSSILSPGHSDQSVRGST